MTEKTDSLIHDGMSDQIIEAAERIAVTVGTENINVRTILHELNITNRVFYNRFHNIDEVLNIVYENMILRIRASVTSRIDPDRDFFTQVIDIVAATLRLSYENKMCFSQFVFNTDTISESNYIWWKNEIKKLIAYGRAQGLLRELDDDVISYAVWCFIRGYNADAIGRGIPKEDAIRDFRYSFAIFLDGLKA